MFQKYLYNTYNIFIKIFHNKYSNNFVCHYVYTYILFNVNKYLKSCTDIVYD